MAYPGSLRDVAKGNGYASRGQNCAIGSTAVHCSSGPNQGAARQRRRRRHLCPHHRRTAVNRQVVLIGSFPQR